MRKDHLRYCINSDTSRLAPQLDTFRWAPAFDLADLDRRGKHEFWRIFGRYTLDTLRTFHSAAIERYPLFPQEDGQPIVSWDGVDPTQHVATLTGALRPCYVAAGLADDGRAIEFSNYDGTKRLTLPHYLALDTLAALGPPGAALRVGERILTLLVQTQPDVFATLRRLTP
jgi:hypothetical protein